MKSTESKPSKTSLDCPIFLRKTYHMIDSCDPSVASWSDDGDTFIVKDPDTFASKIVPQFFKHNNFSSFVRQLNFYGFRKIKIDPIKIKDAVESSNWCFRNANFLRGRPELLSEIKKANQNHGPSGEIDALKSKVDQLTEEMDMMRSEMKNLLAVVTQMKSREESVIESVDENKLKKRKLSQSLSIPSDPIPVAPYNPLPPEVRSNSKVPSELTLSLPEVYQHSMILPKPIETKLGGYKRQSSLDSIDPKMLEDLFSDSIASRVNDELVGLSDIDPVLPPSLERPFTRPLTSDPKLMKKIDGTLRAFPAEAQHVLVDYFVKVLSDSALKKDHAQFQELLNGLDKPASQSRIVNNNSNSFTKYT